MTNQNEQFSYKVHFLFDEPGNADGHSHNGKDECRAKDPSKCRVHGHVGSELSKGIEDRMKGREFGLARHALTDLRWSEGVESAILGKERLGKDGKKVNRKDFATWDVELKMKDGGKCSVQLYKDKLAGDWKIRAL